MQLGVLTKSGLVAGFLLALVGSSTSAIGATDDVSAQLRELRDQNALLAAQLKDQHALIESLAREVTELKQAGYATPGAMSDDGLVPTKSASRGINLGRLNISGEGAVGYFHGGPQSAMPNGQFMVDEAKLFLEAPVWDNTYFFGELDLATRENSTVSLNLGELYLDFQDVSDLWGKPRQLNVRAGRMDIPFGEEYLTRDAIDNPLISHSVVDYWAVDAGVELYGCLGKFSYAVAVQNGGANVTDFSSDKSVAARLGYDPRPWLHFSVSAMRTGDLNAQNDFMSAMWFGGGFFRSIGSTNTTRFHADMLQGDVRVAWQRGHLALSGGAICYDDNDTSGSNRRTMYHYSIEAQQRLVRKLYAAARFSQILAPDGYPLVGNGDFGRYFFAVQSTELWRLSLGLGWRFSDNLLVKGEYTLERGRTVGGGDRNDEDLFALEAALRF